MAVLKTPKGPLRLSQTDSMLVAKLPTNTPCACLYRSRYLQGYGVSRPVSMADLQQVGNQLCSTFVRCPLGAPQPRRPAVLLNQPPGHTPQMAMLVSQSYNAVCGAHNFTEKNSCSALELCTSDESSELLVLGSTKYHDLGL